MRLAGCVGGEVKDHSPCFVVSRGAVALQVGAVRPAVARLGEITPNLLSRYLRRYLQKMSACNPPIGPPETKKPENTATRVMCRVMSVSASGFYEWLGREPSQRSQTDARLTRSIRESFDLSGRTYGQPAGMARPTSRRRAMRCQPGGMADEGIGPASPSQAPKAAWR
jgi:hypothetical protein